jgi:hypothetical protein
MRDDKRKKMFRRGKGTTRKWSTQEVKQFVEDWVENWREDRDLAELAEKYGCTNLQLSSRASYIRKLGINLPRMYTGISRRRKLLKETNEKLEEMMEDL